MSSWRSLHQRRESDLIVVDQAKHWQDDIPPDHIPPDLSPLDRVKSRHRIHDPIDCLLQDPIDCLLHDPIDCLLHDPIDCLEG